MNQDLSAMIQEVIQTIHVYPSIYAACVQVVGNSGVPWQQLAEAVERDM